MAKHSHKNRRRNNLEYESTQNPGEFKKSNKKCLLIGAAFLTAMIVGILSMNTTPHNPAMHADTSSNQQVHIKGNEDKSQTDSTVEIKNKETPKIDSKVKPNTPNKYKDAELITDSYGNKYWIMKTWFRSEMYFTQGFTFVDKHTMLETSGMHGQSVLHHLQLGKSDNKALVDQTKSKVSLERKYFGEGNDMMQGTSPSEKIIYFLTWQSRDIFKYDTDFKQTGKISLPQLIKEGWGMTHDPAEPTIAYISDGTAYVYKVETNNYEKGKQVFKILGKKKILDKRNNPVLRLNELEWANGYIWANIWLTKKMVKIDYSTGKVVNQYDFTKIGSHAQKTAATNFRGFRLDLRNHCLNGIAWMKEDGFEDDEGSFFITGKMWPTVYLVKFENSN